MTKSLGLFACSIIMSFFGCSPEQLNEPQIDKAVIYHGGNIITMAKDSAEYVECLVIQDGKIAYVGNKLTALAQFTEPSQVNLQGKTLVPGFIDGHCHFFNFGAQAVGANLLAKPDGPVNTINDLVNELKKFAKGPDVDKTGWVFGLGYDNAVLKEGRHPTKADLDKVSTELPVIAIHISGHICVLNSKALEQVGYNSETKDPVGGRIRRIQGTTEPNGILEEMAGIPISFEVATPKGQKNQFYFLDKAQETAVRHGYTTAQEGRATKNNHGAMKNYADSGRLKLDVVSYVDYNYVDIVDQETSRTYKNRYRVGGLKITLDGSPQGRTAWRTLPYLLPPDGQSADYVGYPSIPDENFLKGLYSRAIKNDWQVLTHVNGDAAVDQYIRTIGPAIRQGTNDDHRAVLIHGQFIRQDQLDSIAVMNILPSLFPMHTFYWGDWYDKIIGPDLAQKISPTRSARDRGMTLTSHTDAPVALPNLIRVMDATVNRTSRSGKVMGANERLTPYEALQTITIWSAIQHFEEDNKGSLEVGKLADLVILDQNPLTIEPVRIKEIKVMETIKEGKSIYKNSDIDK